MRKSITVICLALTTGCTLGPQIPPTPYTLSKHEVDTVHSTLRKTLKDPESARFGDMASGRTAKGNIVVCGWLNAKNSYGGYTGMTPFIGAFMIGSAQPSPSAPSSFTVFTMGSNEAMNNLVVSECVRDGIKLPTI